MSFFIPCKNFMHVYILKQNLKINLAKNYFEKLTLPNKKTFYILIIKVPRIECPFTSHEFSSITIVAV